MTEKRCVEIFSAGCSVCQDTIQLVSRLACDSCEVQVLDMHDAAVSARAASLGIKQVPTVVIDGVLADCCSSGGPDGETLKNAGIGTSP